LYRHCLHLDSTSFPTRRSSDLGDTNDSSINGNDGINFGATFANDRFGNPNSAIYFDGVNDYVNFPNISELKPDLPISFSFWIKYESYNSDDRDVFNTSFEEDRN